MKTDRDWPKLTIIYVGLFGAALAIAGMMIALPVQATGTCGPGAGSESAAIAFFDPVTIGAQAEPAATDHAARVQWTAFVNGCQTAADTRMYITLPLLAISVGLVVFGVILLLRRNRRRKSTSLTPTWPMPPSGPPEHAPSFGETQQALARPRSAVGPAAGVATLERPDTRTAPIETEATQRVTPAPSSDAPPIENDALAVSSAVAAPMDPSEATGPAIPLPSTSGPDLAEDATGSTLTTEKGPPSSESGSVEGDAGG